jgi:hypothetical protein
MVFTFVFILMELHNFNYLLFTSSSRPSFWSGMQGRWSATGMQGRWSAMAEDAEHYGGASSSAHFLAFIFLTVFLIKCS